MTWSDADMADACDDSVPLVEDTLRRLDRFVPRPDPVLGVSAVSIRLDTSLVTLPPYAPIPPKIVGCDSNEDMDELNDDVSGLFGN